MLAISSSSCYRCCMKISVLLLLGLSATLGAAEPTAAPDAPALTQLLREFLDGASRNDVATHERFWADELIYTRAIGQRLGKADILKEVKTEAASKPTETETSTFSAEDIRVLQYGATAVVAFRLVSKTNKAGKTETANYFNTGTFVKRDGKWQAVAWQATKIPEEKKK